MCSVCRVFTQDESLALKLLKLGLMKTENVPNFLDRVCTVYDGDWWSSSSSLSCSRHDDIEKWVHLRTSDQWPRKATRKCRSPVTHMVRYYIIPLRVKEREASRFLCQTLMLSNRKGMLRNWDQEDAPERRCPYGFVGFPWTILNYHSRTPLTIDSPPQSAELEITRGVKC